MNRLLLIAWLGCATPAPTPAPTPTPTPTPTPAPALAPAPAPTPTPLERFLLAKQLWQDADYARAEVIFRWVIANHPTEDIAEYSVSLMLDGLNTRREYDAAETEVERMLANRALLAGRADLRERLETIKGNAVRRRAELLSQGGDYTGAAALYLEAAAFGASRVDVVLFNAGICFVAAGDRGRARNTWNDLIRRFPRSKMSEQARDRMVELGL